MSQLQLGPGHVLVKFFNSIKDSADFIFSGNKFHKCAPSALRLLVSNLVVC